MNSIFILGAALTLNTLDVKGDSLIFLKCGDQVLIENQSIAVLTSQKALLSDRPDISEWFNTQASSEKPDCLEISNTIEGRDGDKLDFNKVVKRDSKGFDLVYTYDDFGKIRYFDEVREQGRSVQYVYDKNGVLIESIDSANGVIRHSKSGESMTISTYGFNGEHKSSYVIPATPRDLECNKKCVDLFKENKKKFSDDDAREKAKTCIAACP